MSLWVIWTREFKGEYIGFVKVNLLEEYSVYLERHCETF